jgi:hypothetical protein
MLARWAGRCFGGGYSFQQPLQFFSALGDFVFEFGPEGVPDAADFGFDFASDHWMEGCLAARISGISGNQCFSGFFGTIYQNPVGFYNYPP